MCGMASDALVSDHRTLTAAASVVNRMQMPALSLLRFHAVEFTFALAESGSRSKGPAVWAHPLPSISNDAASRHCTSWAAALPEWAASTANRESTTQRDRPTGICFSGAPLG